jgi:redox-sensitive bicupin YhaK (pirin superfamily)
MRMLRASNDRGHFDFGWLDTRHSFSFGEYHDPEHMGFRSLRVLNEDRVQPGQGFGTHGHRDMEILTWVMSGALEHRDSLGTHGVIRPGEAQIMSAGTGIQHSEYNGSQQELVHFLQIWLLPSQKGLSPRYGQVAFDDARFRNRWGLIASPDAADGSVKVFQDVRVHVARLDAGAALPVSVLAGRFGYLHVAVGAVRAGDQSLSAGDALKFDEAESFEIRASEPAEVLCFDLG